MSLSSSIKNMKEVKQVTNIREKSSFHQLTSQGFNLCSLLFEQSTEPLAEIIRSHLGISHYNTKIIEHTYEDTTSGVLWIW